MLGISIRTDLWKQTVSTCVFATFLMTATLFLGSALSANSANSNAPAIEATPPIVPPNESGEIEIPNPSKNIIVEDGEETIERKPNDDVLIENTNKPLAPPKIYSDLNDLPFPARKMRELILEAANSGDIEKFRPFIGKGDDMTMLSLGGFEGDPIAFLKSISGDPEGHELLAIIAELLESDYVLIDEGTDREVYVWPYFYAHSLEELTPQQRVKLFRLLTFGDYQDMESFGAYIFYRIGITPKGRWRFFVAGD